MLESKKVNWRVKVFLSWNMHNHDLWSKCACVQIYSEWDYKLITKNMSPKILTDYWDLAKKFTGKVLRIDKKINWFITENWVSPFKASRIMNYVYTCSFVSDCQVI